MEWLTIDASARDESTAGKKTVTSERHYLVIGGNDYQIHLYQVKFLARRSDKDDLTAPKINTIKTINQTRALFVKGINHFNSNV